MTLAHTVLPWRDLMRDESGALQYALDQNFATIEADGLADPDAPFVILKVHGPYSQLLSLHLPLAELDGDALMAGGVITGSDYDADQSGWQCHPHRGIIGPFNPTLIAGWLTCIFYFFGMLLSGPFFVLLAFVWSWKLVRRRRALKRGALVSGQGSEDSGGSKSSASSSASSSSSKVSAWSVNDPELETLILAKQD